MLCLLQIQFEDSWCSFLVYNFPRAPRTWPSLSGQACKFAACHNGSLATEPQDHGVDCHMPLLRVQIGAWCTDLLKIQSTKHPLWHGLVGQGVFFKVNRNFL